jgi:uncharacterized protein (UPF0248 family)
MFSKERLEKDVLNRIRWDKSLNPNDFTITYLDRTAKELREVRYSDIKHCSDYFIHDGSQIPVHRIRGVKYRGKLVWAERRL